MNDKLNSKVGIKPLRFDNDIAIIDVDKANTLDKFFASVLTWKSLDNVPNVEPISKSNDVTLADMCIIAKAVQGQLKNLNPNKAFGPDGIPASIKRMTR